MMETEGPNNNNSCIFNNRIFGNRNRNKNESAVINTVEKENDEDNIEMKDDTSKKSEDSTYEDAESISDKENKEKRNKETKIKNNKIKNKKRHKKRHRIRQ